METNQEDILNEILSKNLKKVNKKNKTSLLFVVRSFIYSMCRCRSHSGKPVGVF